jgi:hypothetical protein
MQRIRLSALAYLKAWSNWQEDIAHHKQHGVRKDPSAGFAMSQAIGALGTVMKEAQAASPLGWPEETERTLKILAHITGPYLHRPTPSDFPGLERMVQEHLRPKEWVSRPEAIRLAAKEGIKISSQTIGRRRGEFDSEDDGRSFLVEKNSFLAWLTTQYKHS